jgi:3-oxoacyl-(acyl-carrier-protein) synthase
MRTAVEAATPLPTVPLEYPGIERQFRFRTVPAPELRPAFLAHPRLRRTSPITQYAAAAALEAAGSLVSSTPPTRFGLVFCLQSGPVQYATRFFDEVVKDPATASPLLFPETVFSAPASHIAALLGTVTIAYTIVGDPSAFLEGLAMGAAWLEEGRVDACVVVGAEEFNWLQAQAVWHFDHHAILGAGAGAICMRLFSDHSPNPHPGPEHPSCFAELELITGPATYCESGGLEAAARQMRAQFPAAVSTEVLVDGLGGTVLPGKAERAAWRDWLGARLSPKDILGEGLMAASAWQCVLAADAVRNGHHTAACVSVMGFNQQAIGARFTTPK